MKLSLKNSALLLMVFTLLLGCKTRRAIEKSPLVKLNENAILEQVEKNAFKFETLSGKIAVDLKSETQNGSFKINLRMKEDSVIWMSITPALGIEAARAAVTQDTLKFIDKLKDKYYTGSYSFLDSLFHYEADFNILENLLVGNAFQILPDEKYVGLTDDLYYVIQTKNPRKLRKALDISVKPKEEVEDIQSVEKQKKLERAVEKFDDDELIVKRYYIRAHDFRIERTIIEDLAEKRSLSVVYRNFEMHQGGLFPTEALIEISTPKETATFELSYSRIKIDQAQNYPFKIPEKYEPFFQ
jgi:hypothetical protein